MPKFRKKPVVVEAVQWWKMGDHPAVDMVPVRMSLDDEPSGYAPWVETLEGGHVVRPGDWIIRGIRGGYYPCKPDIFAATYEEI